MENYRAMQLGSIPRRKAKGKQKVQAGLFFFLGHPQAFASCCKFQ